MRRHPAFFSALAAAVVLCAPEGGNATDAVGQRAMSFVAPAVSTALPPLQPSTPAESARDTLTIVIGGDIGLGGTDEPVHAEGAHRHGKRHVFADMSRGLQPLINGDINFANLETVVTDRNDLSPVDKTFNFRSHPAGVAHLVRLGFNVFSTANNHAIDYGEPGIRETLKHLSSMPGLLAAPGTGFGYQDASRPRTFSVNSSKIAISAIGIGGSGVRPGNTTSAAMLNYSTPGDFATTVDQLAAAPADYRILSVHYGIELAVRPQRPDLLRLRDEAIKARDVDLVIGHHAHVAAGVARVDGKLVFYGLGNLLHPGMQDMARMNGCRDYGLLARISLERGGDGKWVARAVEAIPLTNMHIGTTPMPVEAAHRRLAVLNHLARDFDDERAGSEGVRFAAQPDGTGLYCAPGAENIGGRIGALCRQWRPAPPAPPAVDRVIAAQCGDVSAVASRLPRAASDRPTVAVAEPAPHRVEAVNFAGDR